MGRITLALDGCPVITEHDATAVALLLAACGSTASLTLATKLRSEVVLREADRRGLELSREERAALREALALLEEQRLPVRLLTLQQALPARSQTADPS